jgi:lipopolysaccharide biosynthesis protein
MRGLVFHDATPEKFRGLLREALTRVADHPAEERIVFLKAWNEWAEGNHIEPDQKWGRGWLEVIREELQS